MLIDKEYARKFLGNPGHLIYSLRVWLTTLLLSQFLCCVVFPPSYDLTEIVMTITALTLATLMMTGWAAIFFYIAVRLVQFLKITDKQKKSLLVAVAIGEMVLISRSKHQLSGLPLNMAVIYALVTAGTIFFYDMDPVKSSASS